LIKRLLTFAETLLNKGGTDKQYGKILYRACLNNQEENPLPMSDEMPLLKRSVEYVNKIPIVGILDFNIKQLAEHMTATDWRIFKRVKCTELLNEAWLKPDREVLAPNMSALVNSFNSHSIWIATEILLSKPKERVKTIEAFVELAKAFKDLKNFHGMVVVYSALNMGQIQKLEASWKSVSKKHISLIKSCEELIDVQKNWRSYRNLLQTTMGPFIPFEGLFFSDFFGNCRKQE